MSMQRAAGSVSEGQGSTAAAPFVISLERVGQILRGTYRIERRLAIGSVTELYQARNLKTQQVCTLKLLRRDADAKLEPQRRFEGEASIISRLSHRHIAEASRFAYTEDGKPFMVMEQLRGCTLQDQLAEEKTLPLPATLRIVEAVGSALQHSHDVGVLHPSVRPGSIFLHREHEGDADFTVKLFDFGLAHELLPSGGPERGPLPLGVIVGTPGYLPPEALQTDAQVSELADQWSLAVLAYRMLTGRLPFQSSDPYLMCALIRTTEPAPLQALRPDLPAHVCEAVNRAMSRDPVSRFARIQDFLRQLQPPAQRTQARKERSDMPATKQFDSRELLRICRQDAVPEPIKESEPTNPYSQEERNLVLTMAQSEAQPVEVSAGFKDERSAALAKLLPARRWAIGVALLTLLSALLALTLLWQSHRRARTLEDATREVALAAVPAQAAPPMTLFAAAAPRAGKSLDRDRDRATPSERPASAAPIPQRKRPALEHSAPRSTPSTNTAKPAPELPPLAPALPVSPVSPVSIEKPEADSRIQMVD